MFPQEGLEVQGPLLAPHQHDGPLPGPLVARQVGHGGVQTDAEGGQLPGLHRQDGLGGQGGGGGGERVQKAEGKVAEAGHQAVHGVCKDGLFALHDAALDEVLYVLAQLPQPVLAPLRHTARLGQAHQCVRRQVLRGGGQLVVPAAQRLVSGALPALGGADGEHLVHRQEHRPVDLGDAPLGGHVEQAHGVHIGVPELHPHRVLLSGGEHVQNAAPQGELTHTLHLLAPGVAQRGQPVGQLVQVVAAPGFQRDGVLPQQLRRQGALEQALHRGGDEGSIPLAHLPEGGQPPVLPLAGSGGPIPEQKLPGGEQSGGGAGESGVVRRQPDGLVLIGADQHHRAAGAVAQPGGEVGPVDWLQTGHRHGGR